MDCYNTDMRNEIISYISSSKLPVTRQDITSMLDKVCSDVVTEMKTRPEHTLEYYNSLSMLLDKVRFEISSRNLFDAPPEWFFSFEISNKNAALYIRHIANIVEDKDKGILVDIDETFRLINYPVKLMTVDEYATRNKSGQVTVRQWIRRGKLRSVIKIGGEWRIPEISDPPTRGYTPVTYYNKGQQLLPTPKEFGVLMNQQPSVIDIYQPQGSKGYMVLFDKVPAILPCRLITEAEREKFELMLISNPNITNSASIVGKWPTVNEVEKIRSITRTGYMALPDGWDTNLF